MAVDRIFKKFSMNFPSIHIVEGVKFSFCQGRESFVENITKGDPQVAML